MILVTSLFVSDLDLPAGKNTESSVDGNKHNFVTVDNRNKKKDVFDDYI